MATIKEWRCLAHGEFEGPQGVCPHGCTTVLREFRTAPGTRSAKTKGIDTNLRRLAEKYGYTDMSNKNGSVGASKKQNEIAEMFKPVWGEIPKGNVFDAGKKSEVARDGASGGAPAALDAIGALKGKADPDEVGFGDIQTGLHRPRPIVPKGGEWGTGADLSKAIERVPE